MNFDFDAVENAVEMPKLGNEKGDDHQFICYIVIAVVMYQKFVFKVSKVESINYQIPTRTQMGLSKTHQEVNCQKASQSVNP